MIKKILITLFLLSAPFQAQANCQCLDILSGPYRIGFGPEFYYVERKQYDHTQDGWMAGERLYFDRVEPWCIYYGAYQYYAQGTVNGRTKDHKNDTCHRHRRFDLTDAEVEGRIGYTLGGPCVFPFLLSPFVGYGNYNGTTEFKHDCFKKVLQHDPDLNFDQVCLFCKKHNPRNPCDVKVRLRPRFNYYTVGIASEFPICPTTVIGLDFKAKFITQGSNKAFIRVKKHEHHHSDDNNDHHHCHKKRFTFRQDMSPQVQYEASIPITYNCCECRDEPFLISIVPFWRMRHYGAKEECPFDFPDTRFDNWGGRILFVWLF